MAKKQITIEICDICKKECKTSVVSLPVRWLTEQTEGRSVEPYIEIENMDLCSECLEKGTVINATGAQGYREFRLSR